MAVSTSPGFRTGTEQRTASAPAPALGRTVRVGPAALAVLVATLGALAVVSVTPGSGLVPATVGGSPDWLLGPIRALAPATGAGNLSGAPILGGLWLALLAYALVLIGSREISRPTAVAAVAGLHAVFLLAPPLLSQDVFSYLAYARLGAVYGLDPYLAAPAAMPADAVFSYTGSKASPSVYGPPFTLATYALAGVPVPVGLWVLKAVAATASLLAVALVWRAAQAQGRDPRAPALLVGLNPVLLVHVVGGAHNDALVLLATAGALLAYAAGQSVRGATLAAAASAVKASAAVLVPFMVAGARREGRSLTTALAAAAVISAALFAGLAGFGAELFGWLGVLSENQARTSSFSVPYKTAELLGALLPGERLSFRVPVRIAFLAVFAASVPWLLLRTWRGADPIAMAGWATLLLLVCSAWLVPWYLGWLLPLAALARSRRLTVAAVGLTAWTLPIAIPL